MLTFALGSNLQTSQLAKTGVQLHTFTHVSSVSRADPDSPLTVTLKAKDGSTSTLEADQLLWAIGRAPASKNLGLEELGIKTDAKGNIIADEWEETNVKGVFSVGDISGSSSVFSLRVTSELWLTNDAFILFVCCRQAPSHPRRSRRWKKTQR